MEERRRLDEERHREATRISERVACERALAEKNRKEEEMRARDRWAHRAEMAPATSSNPTPARSVDVSPNTSSMIPSPSVIAADLGVDPQVQSKKSAGVIDDSSLSSVLELAGSSVPPSAPASTALIGRRNDGIRSGSLVIIYGRCGGNHHVSICQDRDPWEYNEPFFGSEEFGSGFYSIHVPDSDAHDYAI